MNTEPNKVKAVLRVEVTGEFYDEEASEETLRYAVEQDLEDAGFDDIDVSVVKEWWVQPIPVHEALKALHDNGWTECTYNGEVFAMVKPRIERSPDDTLMGLW